MLPPGGAWACIPHPQPAPPLPGLLGSRSALRSAPHTRRPPLAPVASPRMAASHLGHRLCHGCSGQLLLTRSLFLRVGVPAPGDRLPGHLPLPSLDAVCAAQGHPHIPGRCVGFPMADFQNHARSGKYNLLLISCRDVPSCHFLRSTGLFLSP